MKVLILLAAAILVVGFALAFTKWKQARIASRCQALLDQAERASENLDAIAEREYGSLGITTDEILSHENGEKADKVLIALLYRIGQKMAARGSAGLTETERKLRAVSHVEAQVNNGGFDQYFFNPSGDDAETALAGLEEIGAKGSAELVRRAIAAFPNGIPPKEREIRWKVMEDIKRSAKPVWDQCDKEFYSLEENIDELALAFAKQRRSKILLP